MIFLNKIKIELLLFFIISVVASYSLKIDTLFNNFFLISGDSLGNPYLREFFEKLTELGNSIWYFSIIFISTLFLLINNKVGILKISNHKSKINFFISSFFYIFFAGFLTQVFKHVVGRPRPNYTDFETISFEYFTLDSNFHSFPSGHSSTIFMVCFILCSLIPKLKYFFYILASLIAYSRVVVGAHFFTDILAGAILSLIVYKLLSVIFEKNLKKYSLHEIKFKEGQVLIYCFVILSCFCLFLTIGPALDLYVSGLFYFGDSQFYLQSFDILSLLFREIFLPIILIYLLIFPIFTNYFRIDKLFFGYKFLKKEILLIWSSQVLIVLIIVNVFLKGFWGRSRPGDIVDYGGKEYFTPWYEIGLSCNSNCSFVSGDASVGFSIIILYLITKNVFFIYTALIAGFGLGIIRILEGGHFLSDVVFSGFIIISLNIITYQFYKKHYDK